MDMYKTANDIADEVLFKMAKRKGEYRDPGEMTEAERKKIKRRHWGKHMFAGPLIASSNDLHRIGKGETTYYDIKAWEAEQNRLKRREENKNKKKD
jgi:hypothetical protein